MRELNTDLAPEITLFTFHCYIALKLTLTLTLSKTLTKNPIP